MLLWMSDKNSEHSVLKVSGHWTLSVWGGLELFVSSFIENITRPIWTLGNLFMFISSSLKCPPSLVVLVFWDPTTIITPPRWYWCWRKDNLRTRNIFNALNSFSRFDIIIRGVIYGTSMDQTQHILLANIWRVCYTDTNIKKEAIWFIIHTNNQEKIFVNANSKIISYNSESKMIGIDNYFTTAINYRITFDC